MVFSGDRFLATFADLTPEEIGEITNPFTLAGSESAFYTGSITDWKGTRLTSLPGQGTQIAGVIDGEFYVFSSNPANPGILNLYRVTPSGGFEKMTEVTSGFIDAVIRIQ